MSAPAWWLKFKKQPDRGRQEGTSSKAKKPSGTGPYKHGALFIRGKHMALLAPGSSLAVWESVLYKQGFIKVVPLTEETAAIPLSEWLAKL